MFPPRLRLPLSNLAAFALGAGLAAAWFLGREPANPEVARAQETGTSPRVVAANASETSGRPSPWKTKSDRLAPPQDARQSPVENVEESESMNRGLRAQLRHEARIEVLELSYHLGLEADQAASLQTEVLAKLDAPGLISNPFNPEGLVEGMVIQGLMDLLTDPQREKLARYRESKRHEETERHALEETNKIARVMELTEEQRAALIQKFADTHVSIDEFAEFIHYGEPIDVKATAADGTPTTVVITESRIEMPVFTHRNPWFAEILTEDQLATYREFQANLRDLEIRRAEEMRAAEEQ